MARSLSTKGWISKAISLATKGWISIRGGEAPPVWPEPTYCDYPHAVKMATAGRLGAVVGTASRGVVLRICIEEFPIEEPRTTGPGRRGFREEEKKKKCVKITVFAYGKKYVSEHCVDENVKVSVNDIEVVDNGQNIIGVKIRNVNKS